MPAPFDSVRVDGLRFRIDDQRLVVGVRHAVEQVASHGHAGLNFDVI